MQNFIPGHDIDFDFRDFEISTAILRHPLFFFFRNVALCRSGRSKRIVTKNETRIMHGAIFLLLVLSFSFLSTFLFLLFFFLFFFFLSGGLSGFISFGKSSLLTSQQSVCEMYDFSLGPFEIRTYVKYIQGQEQTFKTPHNACNLHHMSGEM